MATETSHAPLPRTLDLTGLPDPVVRQVTQLVQEARQKQAEESAAPQAAQFPTFISRAESTPEEFERALDDMAAMGTGQALPLDWSRADIYDDHD